MSLKTKHKKLKGFTTMELSIVMLMAGLISSLAWGSYTFLTRQFYTYSKNTTGMIETRQGLNLLKKDIHACRWLYADGDRLECFYEKQIIQYDLANENYLVRTQMQRSDTFQLNVLSKYFMWMKKPYGTGRTIIDEVIMATAFKKSTTEIRFKKQYSNQDLMDLHNDHGN